MGAASGVVAAAGIEFCRQRLWLTGFAGQTSAGDCGNPQPDAPTTTRTLRDATAFEMSVRIAAAQFLSALGALGLVLAAIGLYGIVSYLVASQTRELGVRMALGASPERLRNEVTWRGMRLMLWGLGAGLVFSLAGARLLAVLLAGLSPADPISFAGSAAVSLAMGVIASCSAGAPCDQNRSDGGAARILITRRRLAPARPAQGAAAKTHPARTCRRAPRPGGPRLQECAIPRLPAR